MTKVVILVHLLILENGVESVILALLDNRKYNFTTFNNKIELILKA